MSEPELKERLDALLKALRVAVETLEAGEAALRKSTAKPAGGGPGMKGGQVLAAGTPKLDQDKVRAAFARSAEDIQAALAAFSREFDAFATELAGTEGAETPKAAGLEASLPSKVAAVAAPGTLSAEFADFIKSVGLSVADAQTSLDRMSRVYSAGHPLLPTLFRIPKLTAEMRFALNVEQNKKLSLIFFSESQKAAAEHQQSISFDVVSTPPPPELLAAMKREAPVLPLVLDDSSRAPVFAAVAQAQEALDQAARDELEAERLLGEGAKAQDIRDRVLIVPVPEADDSAIPSRYLLLAANPARNAVRHAVGIWCLETDKARLDVVLQFSRAGTDSEQQAPLKKFVNLVAEKQAAFLATLRGT